MGCGPNRAGLFFAAERWRVQPSQQATRGVFKHLRRWPGMAATPGPGAKGAAAASGGAEEPKALMGKLFPRK